MHTSNKQITFVSIDHKERVHIIVGETVMISTEEEGAPAKEVFNQFPVLCQYKPHKDFMDALLSCRKYGLELIEMETESRTQFTVLSLKIKGNMAMQNARVEFTLSKYVKRSGKTLKLPCGEVTMYGDDYKKTAEMTKAVEKVLDEASKYMGGKNGESIALPFQFVLFEDTTVK